MLYTINKYKWIVYTLNIKHSISYYKSNILYSLLKTNLINQTIIFPIYKTYKV